LTVSISACCEYITIYCWLFCLVCSTAVQSHSEGVVGILDVTDGFPYGKSVQFC